MKYTVTLPPLDHNPAGDGAIVGAWHRQIGEMVAAGDTLLTVRSVAVAGEAATEWPVVSPAFGILARKIVLPGEAVEVGEPVALLSGVPPAITTGDERLPTGGFASPPAYISGGPEEVVALSAQALALARHAVRSAQTAPTIHTTLAVDVAEVVALAVRRQTTIAPFVVATVAAALVRFPDLNAEGTNGGAALRRKRYIHLGIAGRDTSGDLTVAVIPDADKRSVAALARHIAAPQSEAAPPATFTLRFLHSAHTQTAILHQPQVAFLTVGAVAPGSTLTLCLSHDARYVTETTAEQFLAAVGDGLADGDFLFSC